MKRRICLALLAMTWATAAAAITVDGTRDAEYGSAIAVQAVNTGFGDVLSTTVLGGSELDAAYATITGGRLYLMLTGNHEPNFNKLEVYFDTIAGGEDVLSATPQYDYSGDGGANWNSQNQAGLTFDTGFTADYHLFSRWGGNDAPTEYEVDFVNRQGGVNAMVPASVGKSPGPAVDLINSGVLLAGNVATYNTGAMAPSTALTQDLHFAINNSNIAGVVDCGGNGCDDADQNAALAVTTGMEFSIALADLGNPAPGSSIRIAAVISNSDHNYLSNQSLGPFTPPQDNPGGSGNNPGDGFNEGSFTGTLAGMDFNNFDGQQYFSITVPMAVALPGDFNANGKVDAADYTVWRDNLNAPDESSLNGNGNNMDGVDQGDYDLWKSHFGDGGSGALAGGAVPEPSAAAIVWIGLLIASSAFRRNR
jgi:hypothetical protein